MALSDTNKTGFCTTFCENEYNGVSNATGNRTANTGLAFKGLTVSEVGMLQARQAELTKQGKPKARKTGKPKKPYESDIQRFLKRAKQ